MFFYSPAKSIDRVLYSFIAAAQPVSENKKRNGSQRKYLKKTKGCPEKVESKVISDRSIFQFHWSASRKENSFFSFLSLSLATKRKYNWCNNAINSTQKKGIKYRNAIWNLLLLYQGAHIKANGGTQVQQHMFCEKVKMFTEMVDETVH